MTAPYAAITETGGKLSAVPPSAQQMPIPPTGHPVPATGWWLVAYVAAVVYASLYPWSGWQAPGPGMFDFVTEPWPRWWTRFDVATNVLAYVPLGLLLAVWLRRGLGMRPASATGIALVFAVTLSCALESLQSLLPERVPSRLDVIANAAGAAIGAAIATSIGASRVGTWLGSLSAAVRLRPHATSGLLLLCAWPIAQWYPQSMVFATGDLLIAWPRPADDAVTPWWTSLILPGHYEPFAEAAGVSLAVVAVGLVARDLLLPMREPPAWQAFWPLVLPIVAACAIKTAASTAVLGKAHALGWLNAAAQGGLIAGALALLVLGSSGPRMRLRWAIAAIAAGTVLFNLAPPNEYYLGMLANWGGAWTNFHGLTRALATIWPYAAIAWCAWRLRSLRRVRRL